MATPTEGRKTRKTRGERSGLPIQHLHRPSRHRPMTHTANQEDILVFANTTLIEHGVSFEAKFQL